MGWISLGRITVANSGTPVQVTSLLPAGQYNTDGKPKVNYAPAEAIMIQAASTNTGKVYVGLSGFTKSSTAVGQKLATLAVPTANTIPAVTVSIPGCPAAINASEYWLDVDNNGEGADVSILVP